MDISICANDVGHSLHFRWVGAHMISVGHALQQAVNGVQMQLCLL